MQIFEMKKASKYAKFVI